MNIVIVGNGAAGLSAAEEIRKHDPSATITMVTEESYYTYYRTRLSHYLSKDFSIDEIYIHPENWYRDNKIDIILETKVKKINTNEKTVIISEDKSLPYDKLLLANGASSFVPPVEGSDSKGVFSLRDMDDVKSIQKFSKTAKKATVVGGGLLGLEAANALKELGLDVTVVEFAPRLLPRQMDEEASNVVKKIVEDQGISLYLNAQVEKIEGNPVTGCILKGGDKVDADLVLFSTGVRSNISLAKDAEIATDKAIIVNEYMETSAKDIYAAGDVAEFNQMSFNIWPIAIEQGKMAGRNMIGKEESYEAITPSNMLTILNVKAFSLGDIEGKTEGLNCLRDRNDTKFKKLFFKDGKLAGAILINDIAMAGKLKKKMGEDYSHLLKEDISDKEKIEKL
ncbi:NAD(P)/FAD-dependent oxidoreductase [Alkalibacter saccharofermentans]|uniref:Nitrite reductase (NADH) large subunit n=1 Tax=Alkalibacter saccharofermentans DSM 14828 TaxID=1120975 RepID=A0A1M4X042_9FIRM|nr:FAD-dependent oxidoreductase [Alkalibacter saccharofermentans]SHE86830.1 nitrite reductase (NADH) large subunit [Alkalibacter saccharofermentans DSM 14828]